MSKLIFIYFSSFLILVILILLFIAIWNNNADRDELARTNAAIWQLPTQPLADGRTSYDREMVAGLPEGVQRYFNFMITPGAKLRTVSRIEMEGEFGLGDAQSHSYYPFTATQYNAPTVGFTWGLKTHDTVMAMHGSDIYWAGQSWTKFWLFGIFPVARAGGNEDYLRSGFGRLAIEMAAWSPIALLPQYGVGWAQLDAETIRATVEADGLSQEIFIKIADDGAPTAFYIDRWSDANPDKAFRLQPFGGTAKGFIEKDGVKIVEQIEAGNHYGTDDFFAFFKARVTKLEFQP